MQAGAVMIVGGIDIGLLILASLQSGTSPAQDQLAAGEPKNMHIQVSTLSKAMTLKSALFFTST